MSAALNILNRKKNLIFGSNPAVPPQTDWNIVFGRAGFADSAEHFAGNFVGQKIQHFRLTEEVPKLPETDFFAHGAFKAKVVRHGIRLKGQQQCSGAAAVRLVIEARGV